MATQVAPAQTETPVTAEELLAMGDVGPSELVEGRIVRISPTGFEHGDYEGNFYEHLKAFVRERKLVVSPVDFDGCHAEARSAEASRPETLRGFAAQGDIHQFQID